MSKISFEGIGEVAATFVCGEGVEAGEVAAISIDGTSGTIVPLDKANRPLSNALMYNDPRAKAEATAVHAARNSAAWP